MAVDRGELARAVLLLDDDHGESVRRPGDLDLLTGRTGRIVSTEHQDLVRVLVVGDQHLTPALTGQRDQGEEVVVVTELARLRLGGLLVRVEAGSSAQDRLAPADHDVLAVAVGDRDLVVRVGRDGLEAQATGARSGGLRLAAGAARGGHGLGGPHRRADESHGSGGGRHGHHGGGPHHRPARQGTGDDVAGVLVVAGVRDLLEAGVTAAVAAGQRRAPALVRADER